MKQQQPLPIYLDPVIRGDFQQLEPLTELRALTSMQLPPRTMSFIMKGVKQSPHTARLTHTHTHTRVRSDALRVTNDKYQLGEEERWPTHFSFFSSLLKSPCHLSAPSSSSSILLPFIMGFISCTNFFFLPPTPRP